MWLVHGLHNKVLHGSPRHLAIVQSVPGLSGGAGETALFAVGVAEIVLAAWVISRWHPRTCAAVQTILLLSMNGLELTFAAHLLIWPEGLIPINIAFLGLAWVAASDRPPATLLTRLRRHPIPIEAKLRDCLTLTYALPPAVLRRLLPPGLELEVFAGHAFVAVALVEARSLRPAGFPARVGQDFFLAGYRIFVRHRLPDGRTLRGLRILRSDTDKRSMVIGGNLLTHYNYHRCAATVDRSDGRLRVAVRTKDEAGDVDVIVRLPGPGLPAGSPFRTLRDARRFAGPLPFTFDHEPETGGIVAIRATRAGWHPEPVAVELARAAFFERPEFAGCTPILAAAFHVKDIDYRWERGTRLDAVPSAAAA